jgi:hypothetical protein
MNPTDRVHKAIEATRRVAPGYFEKCCAQRAGLSPTQRGSVYEGADAAGVEALLETATWEEAAHPCVMAGCTAFRAPIPGRNGSVDLASLDPEARVRLEDPKGTGEVSATVYGAKGAAEAWTWLIVGLEAWEEIVFTFPPGEPAPYRPVKVTEALGLPRWATVRGHWRSAC